MLVNQTSETTKRERMLESLRVIAREAMISAHRELRGVEVTLLCGRYKGRKGVIEDVIIGERGNFHRIACLVRPLRLDGEPMSDRDADARSYWDLDQLEGWK